MKFNLRIGLFLVFWVLLYNSCQKSTLLRSARSIRTDIQGTWTMVSISDGQIDEQWRFVDGAILRYERNTFKNFAKVDSGVYAINTTLTEPYLITSELGSSNCYNAKWTIIRLDDDALIIIHDQDCKGVGKGLLTREFYKVK